MNKKKETLHWDLDSAGIELHACSQNGSYSSLLN